MVSGAPGSISSGDVDTDFGGPLMGVWAVLFPPPVIEPSQSSSDRFFSAALDLVSTMVQTDDRRNGLWKGILTPVIRLNIITTPARAIAETKKMASMSEG